MKGTLSYFASALDRRRRDERGVTLIELLVAITIFGMISSALAIGLGSTLSLSRNNRNRSIAANLAAREMDLVRSADFQSIVEGRVDSEEVLDGIPYLIHRDAEWVTKSGSTGACDSPQGSQPAFLRVTVSVEWPNMAGAQPVQSQTILTPPVGAYDASSGHLAVKVLDRSAQPVSGLQVVIDGPSGPRSQFTADGCAFFSYLQPGSYSAAMNTAGYVDPEGVQAPTQSSSVVEGTISSLQFDYDSAATLELIIGQDTAYPVPEGLPLTLGNPSLLLSVKTFTGAGNPRTIGNLFPFLEGYEVWAGACEDNDPEGELPDGAGLIYPGGQRDAALPVDAGSTTGGTVVMELVEVVVTDGATGLPATDVPVSAQHDAGEGCSASDIDLGSTDAEGVVRVSLPYGQWTFDASGAVVPTVLDPIQADPTVVEVTV